MPIILTILSFYLAFKFKNDSYIINLINDILSNRVAIWNNIIQNYNVILLPQYIRSTAYIWTITTQNILSLISYQGLDGFFIMSNYMYGIIIGGVYLIALTYMLYLLLKEPIRNHLILCLSVCWIFIGFSETVVGYYYMSFLLPLAFNVIANSNVRDKNV
ncbi:hypothetical protein IMAU30115_01990 [Lactobacillus helveticus]|nr:hypothetical protein [Lactobacillus helveticus]